MQGVMNLTVISVLITLKLRNILNNMSTQFTKQKHCCVFSVQRHSQEKITWKNIWNLAKKRCSGSQMKQTVANVSPNLTVTANYTSIRDTTIVPKRLIVPYVTRGGEHSYKDEST